MHIYLTFFTLLALSPAVHSFPKPASLLDSFFGVGNDTQLQIRADDPPALTTCGYLDGNPAHFRTPNAGFNCRFDADNKLWGYCPTTVNRAVDCGLAGACIDGYDCSKGCGDTKGKLTTFTCSSTDVCSTAVLALANKDNYYYIACGTRAVTDKYFISPTPVTTTEAPKVTTNPPESAASPAPSKDPAPAVTSTSNGASKTSTATNPATTGDGTTGNGSSNSSSGGSGGTGTNNSSTDVNVSSGGTGSPVQSASSTAGSGASGQASSQGSGTNNTPAIIGGVIGGIALLCIFGLAAIYLIRRDKKASQKRNREAQLAQQLVGRDFDDKKDRSHRDTGGWGPRELPSERHEAVELPS